MTCQDFDALCARGGSLATNAEVAAGLKHCNDCQRCRQIIQDMPDETDPVKIAAMDAKIDRVWNDPECKTLLPAASELRIV